MDEFLTKLDDDDHDSEEEDDDDHDGDMQCTKLKFLKGLLAWTILSSTGRPGEGRSEYFVRRTSFT